LEELNEEGAKLGEVICLTGGTLTFATSGLTLEYSEPYSFCVFFLVYFLYDR